MKRLITFFFMLLIMVSFGSRELFSQNMLTNPGFEAWTAGPGGPPDNWVLSATTSFTATQEAALIHGGTYSCKLTWTTTSNRDIQQINIPVTGGNNYEFSTWALDNDPGGEIAIYIRWETSTGTYISNSVFIYSVDNPNWQYLTTGIAEAPATAGQCQVRVRCYDVAGWPGTATVYIDDAELEDLSGALPTITMAYAISGTAMDVLYSDDLTSVDPGDYTLSGTANITFSSAIIDGSNPKLVHLTGASPAMVGDIILDNVHDDANSTDFAFYAGIMPVYYTNTTNPTGTMDNVHVATFRGIVSANDANNSVWMSDAAGAYRGVMIFDYNFDGLVAQGDDIIFRAVRSDYNGQTELINPGLISIVSSGNTPYGPTLINGSYISQTIPSNTDPAESYEGQLVKIENFTVTSYVNYDYTCSWTSGANTYYFHIGDNVAYQFTGINLTVGGVYQSIAGVIDWYWSGPYYRINPRTQADIIQASNPPVKLAVTSVNGGANPYANYAFDVIVQAQDAGGVPAVVSADLNFTFTTNGGTLGNVIFVPGSTITGTILAGTSEVTVTGVKMAPAGTGVTITATDDLGGLAAGTSATFDVLQPVIPDIIITEIMQNPLAVADAKGEWFEVFNTTSAPIDMMGWIIKDDGTNIDTIKTSLIVPAHGFAVLGNNDTAAVNGGYTCNYRYKSSFALGNADDEIVLVLPDGSTEVDRVMYDDGATFPDPNGASMVYTGTPADDNNDGANWVTATLREPTFTGSTGDLGSPGTEGYDQNLVTVTGITVDLKVWLEGPYDAVTLHAMNTTLLSMGLIPLAQPFNPTLPYYSNPTPKWLYAGTESVASIPAGVVDWVLVELRDGGTAGTNTIARQACFILSNGKIVGLDGASVPGFPVTPTGDLYAVVYHRNHQAVMTATGMPVAGSNYTWDFTTGSGQFYGGINGGKQLETGAWGARAGDGDANNQTNNDDKIVVWKPESGTAGYKGGDYSLDGQVNNGDKIDRWKPNSGTASQVPN